MRRPRIVALQDAALPSVVRFSIDNRDHARDRHDALSSSSSSSSSSHHSGGEDDGRFQLTTMEEAMREGWRYRDVVFCAPPSGFDDYPRAVDEVASSLWSVFTSSGVVYGEGRGEVVDEASPTPGGDNPRVTRMLDVEFVQTHYQDGGYQDHHRTQKLHSQPHPALGRHEV
jgi:hypothetical protein